MTPESETLSYREALAYQLYRMVYGKNNQWLPKWLCLSKDVQAKWLEMADMQLQHFKSEELHGEKLREEMYKL